MDTTVQKKKSVFVGLSGGVDSSLAAKRLIDAGYDVTGVFIKTWQPDFLPCTWEAERLDAMRVAAQLGIPFYTCDAEKEYRDNVAEYMINEYKVGKTPNPDVVCNQFVKFGAFLKYALSQGADMIATGHYAQVTQTAGMYSLLRGKDEQKDQSYFLWTLTQEQLSRIYFPVGNTYKSEVRKEAENYDLITSHKTDSQGICFLGEVNMKDFLSHYVEMVPGNVLDKNNNVIGTHDGALFYTKGQRHGFSIDTKSISSSAHYVVSKDMDKNTITVSTVPSTTAHKEIFLHSCNFSPSLTTGTYHAQFRYRQKPFKISLVKLSETKGSLTIFDENIESPSVGQSCVIYDGNLCLGGGIIGEII